MLMLKEVVCPLCSEGVEVGVVEGTCSEFDVKIGDNVPKCFSFLTLTIPYLP